MVVNFVPSRERAHFLGGEVDVCDVLIPLYVLLYTIIKLPSPFRRRPHSFEPTSLIGYRQPCRFDAP